ncbi:MAG: hypothetical protein ACD_58C00006G0004 [uncultured bacterium]|nr:MAG: hypothetical protein ACD_58C00006G0004 [uncultured bacterium]
MKKCSICKETYSNSDNYCWNDGSKLKKSIDPKCPGCGIMKIGKFCRNCGIELKNRRKNEARG